MLGGSSGSDRKGMSVFILAAAKAVAGASNSNEHHTRRGASRYGRWGKQMRWLLR